MAYAAFLPPPEPLQIDSAQMADVWHSWRDSWSHYATAAKIMKEDKDIQVATFLTCIGKDARRVYSTFEWSSGEDKTCLNNVIKKFEQHCLPRTNIPFERYKFNKRQQLQGETFDTYVTELRQIANNCDFNKQTPDEVLRDRIIFGILDNKVRERLLRSDSLDLRRTLEICRAAESSQAQIRELNDTPTEMTVHAVKEKSHLQNDSPSQRSQRQVQFLKECRFCGKAHEKSRFKCPAWGKMCNKCGSPNHFASRCRQTSRVNAIESDATEDNYLVFSVSGTSDCNETVTMQLPNGNYLKFQLDTGAQCNVVPLHLYQGATGDTKLQKVVPSNAHIVSYGGTRMPVVGCVRLKVRRRDLTCYLDCKIINAPGMRPILGMRACTGMKLVTITDSDAHFVPDKSVHAVTTLLNEEEIFSKFGDVFNDDLGLLKGAYTIKIDHTVPTVQHTPRKLPMAVRDRLKEELLRLEKRGIIAKTECPTPWVSSIVVVPKKNDGLRICLDPKDLNRAIRRELYPIPSIEDITHKFNKAKMFSVLDAKNGFWQIQLDDESTYLTTFNTPFGRYRFLRMPFGISSAPEIFQRRMHELIEGLRGVEVIADDFVVVGYGDSEHEASLDHEKNLEAFLVRCREKGLKMNRDKIKLRQPEVPFIGHVATKDGLKVHPEKVKAIQEMPRPQDLSDLRRFLGMVQYLAKFVPKLSDITEPLRKLTQKDVPWCWNSIIDEAFETVKSVIASAAVLRYYDVSHPVVIQCDASQSGLGASLLQDGQPVAFASRSLTDTEKRYAQIEKELLAIVWSCEKFDAYLYGRGEITIESDHKPLENIIKKPLDHAPMRLQRMLLRLQRYTITVVYKRGEEMYIADTLSRAYLPYSRTEKEETVNQIGNTISPLSLNKVREATLADPIMKDLYDIILKGWPARKSDVPLPLTPFWDFKEELTIQDDLILKRNQVLIPVCLRRAVLEAIHEAHIGIDACLRRARECIFWPRMNADVKSFIGQCDICQSFRNQQAKEPLLSHELPCRPWSKIAMDLCESHGRQLLVVVDYFSSFIEVKRLTKTTSRAIITTLGEIFARFGIPEEIVSDNGPQFASADFAKFCSEWGIDHITSSPLYPQSNGKCENAVKIVKRMFDKCRGDGTSEYKALLNWRNTPSTGMSSSPSQRLMGRRCRTFLPTVDKLLQPAFDVVEASREMAGQRAVQRHYFNKTAHSLAPLQDGSTVRMRLPQSDRWTLGTVRRMVAPRSYEVEVAGAIYRRNRRHLQATQERVVPRIAEDEEVTRRDDLAESPDRDATTKEEPALEAWDDGNENQTPVTETPKTETPERVQPTRARRRPRWLEAYDTNSLVCDGGM